MESDKAKRSEPDLKLSAEAETTQLSDDRFAADLRGFGPAGIVAIIIIVLFNHVILGNILLPVGGILVLLWANRSHTPWREIGYVRPRSWVGSLIAGVVFGITFKLLMKAIVMPLFDADPINHAYHYLVGNKNVLTAAVWNMAAAGFTEETVFRGFLFERLGKLFGTGIRAKILIVLLTSALFGLLHYADQGLTGVEQAMITGLVFGTIFAATGRIFMVMVAHSAFDLTALAIIYLNRESEVAHFFFK
jgi:membrane protease YdiL (CAAX protease family)